MAISDRRGLIWISPLGLGTTTKSNPTEEPGIGTFSQLIKVNVPGPPSRKQVFSMIVRPLS